MNAQGHRSKKLMQQEGKGLEMLKYLQLQAVMYFKAPEALISNWTRLVSVTHRNLGKWHFLRNS